MKSAYGANAPSYCETFGLDYIIRFDSVLNGSNHTHATNKVNETSEGNDTISVGDARNHGSGENVISGKNNSFVRARSSRAYYDIVVSH